MLPGLVDAIALCMPGLRTAVHLKHNCVESFRPIKATVHTASNNYQKQDQEEVFNFHINVLYYKLTRIANCKSLVTRITRDGLNKGIVIPVNVTRVPPIRVELCNVFKVWGCH